ncbi:cold-shock protein [Actinokineospora sp. UTMC 2448]|uniref:cold-shock protein n=1 Tax=Actinokineospora sp. UTMC 2448 TaxID=2268449 RepID=UPI002164BD4C|nr:cold shock domain-containing protein [Actinokineospora sp. UTMC 2448]
MSSLDNARTYTGVVAEWHEDEGWGVIHSSDLDRLVWAHFSCIDSSSHRVVEAGGFRVLKQGDRVRFTVEQADQDGFQLRATWITTEGPNEESSS